MLSAADNNDKHRPYLRVNIFSRFFHHWISNLLRKCRRQGALQVNDLYDIPQHLQSTKITDKMETNWFDEIHRQPQNPSLMRATIRTLGWQPFLIGLMELLNGFIRISQPLLLTFLMSFFEPCSKTPTWHAWLFTIATIAIALISATMSHTYIYQIDQICLKARLAYMGLVFRKVLRLSSHSMNKFSSGEITNLMANDAREIELALCFFNYLWMVPILMIAITYLFWYFVRYIAFIAVGYTVILLLIQPIFGRIIVHLRTKALQVTDSRVRIMSEIIRSMRIVKMYCWESAFIKRIRSVRRREINQYCLLTFCDNIQTLLSANYIDLRFNTYFFAIASCMLASMRLYVVAFFSNAIHDLSRCLSAQKRIQTFLLLDESERDQRLISKSHEDLVDKTATKVDHQILCHLKHARWNQDDTFALKNIVFDAHPGDLICVIGPVGSGKSSLLQTLTGEIAHFDGRVRLHGSFCYVPQEAWIFSSTIKNNILFGKEYNHKLFQLVIRATALDIDFGQLSHGVNTLVGDQGVMLSGGQKARVNMARALYRDADIYLLDDPLSAVDVKVSKHLFKKAIKECLHSKICILVTHQIQYLQEATKIIVLDQGEMVHIGTYDELISSVSSFARLLEDIHQHEEEVQVKIQQQQSRISSKHSEIGNEEELDPLLTQIDKKQEGSVGWHVYLSYVRAGLGSLWGFLLIMLLLVAQQTMSIYSRWWLASWSDDENHRYGPFNNCTSTIIDKIDRIHSMSSTDWNQHRNHRFYTYCILVLVVLLVTFLRTSTAKLMCLNAGRVLHNKMFQRVIRCPIGFFDTNPIGRILNRFTSDVRMMDDELMMNLTDFLECLSEVLGTIILVGFINPWSFIPAGIGICGMLIVRYHYARCYRDLKRLEGVTRSPIFSYLNSTIHGLKVIRSYHAERMCSEEFLRHLDNNSRANFLTLTVERWGAMRFDFVSSIFLALVTIFAVLARIHGQTLSTADIALTLSYSINLMGLFQWTIRQNVEVEAEMTAVERVLEYCRLEQEPPAQVPPKNRPSAEWPTRGRIVLNNVSMSYSDEEHAPLALHNISLTIEGGEKIGIVGRTGAGKSSFIQILFRMGNLVDGQIIIDHINIENIGLDDVRSRLSIIPQDPVLFTGTMRNNLDPFYQYSDDQLWTALEQVQLKDLVKNIMPNGLDSIVSESGSNLSVGQKQLVCLARAILKKSKILVIDEATANVDNATDELIQKALRSQFNGCTVLTVAHRLRTVIDNDRIMVLDYGHLVEFDTPQVLLSDPQSSFSSLVEQTGPVEANYLRTLARQEQTLSRGKL